MQKKIDRLCGLVVRVPGYRTVMYCVSCEVRTEFIYVMLKKAGLENQDYGPRGSAALTLRHPFYPQKLALTSPTSSGRCVGIVRSRPKVTDLVSYLVIIFC
jgi:hypothetical protein